MKSLNSTSWGFQLCKRGLEIPDSPKWYFEPKLNGVRMAVIYTREGHRACGREAPLILPPHILKALPSFPVGTVLDGEFLYGEDNHSAWSVIGRSNPPALGEFAVFDCILGPKDRKPLCERKDRLIGAIMGEVVTMVPWWPWIKEGWGRTIFLHFKSTGLEGMVAKRLDKPYKAGRHSTWLKFKKKS